MEDSSASSDHVAHDGPPSSLPLTTADKISTTTSNKGEEDSPTSLVDEDQEEEEDYSSINIDSIIDTSIIGVDFSTTTTATCAGETTTTEPTSMDLHNHSDLLDRSGIDPPDDDDIDTATATAPQQNPPKRITGADVPVSVPALEPSIMSGTTDLFEGDLCDDELDEIPSIMMPNGTNTYDENLQLNPVDLVDEVQAEMEQEAARDPDVSVVVDATTSTTTDATIPAADTHVTDNTSTNTTSTTITDAHPLPQSGPRRPVVPFVVRKLSEADTTAGKKRAATPSSTSTAATPETKKARQNASSKSTATKKATTTTTATTGRITRSRAKNVESTSTQSRRGAPTPTSNETNAKEQQHEAMDVTTDPPKPKANKIVLPNDPTLKTETVVSASTSVASAPDDEPASHSLPGGRGPGSTVSVVTPMESDDTINAKQLAMQSKMECASISFPNLRKDDNSGATGTSSVNETEPRKEESNVAAAPTAALNDKAPSSSTPKKSTSRRSSASKTGAASKRASSDGSGKKSPSLPVVSVDTSTAHIQALTGENGASVCLSIRNCAFLAEIKEDKEEESSPPSIGKTTSNEDNASSQTGSQLLTEEQRAQQSRDRNRRHARNTRLRKKAYVEELKQTLVELVNQRDQALEEQEQNQQRESEQREVRFRVMEEFLKLRGRNEQDVNRWSAIFAPNFSLLLPLTPFQEQVVGSTVDDTNNNGGQLLKGVEQVMQDSCNHARFLQTLGPAESDSTVSLVYQCDRKDFMMDGCDAVLGWNARSVGAMKKGTAVEISFRGSLRAHFCPESNRLRSTDMMFDTGVIVAQRDALLG